MSFHDCWVVVPVNWSNNLPMRCLVLVWPCHIFVSALTFGFLNFFSFLGTAQNRYDSMAYLYKWSARFLHFIVRFIYLCFRSFFSSLGSTYDYWDFFLFSSSSSQERCLCTFTDTHTYRRRINARPTLTTIFLIFVHFSSSIASCLLLVDEVKRS